MGTRRNPYRSATVTSIADLKSKILFGLPVKLDDEIDPDQITIEQAISDAETHDDASEWGE